MGSGKESILPVQTLISVLDAYYNLCGFPWWVIIATSTLAFRLALLPVVVLQLCKLRNIGELSPKLPPPFPPPQSGRSFIDQISLFRRETKTIGCPSFLWFLASLSIQQLSLKHPAVRVKLGLPDKDAPSALEKSEEIDSPGKHLDSPAKQRKISLKDLTPKGPVALSVKHLSKGPKERAISFFAVIFISCVSFLPVFILLALDKDLDYISALIVMGQTQLRKGLLAEAIEYLERAISKLFISGHPTELENIDLLIVASQWAGVAYIKQGQMAEGIVHLERIANLEELEEESSKVHYYDGLVLLSSALYNVGCKAEAVKHLRLAAA
ncbi:hypothetical protein Patl1_24092 [Pistacia atlantica]|uniref:Uncharacterized protein n=1 Tax=Pistacia atlantica TaxID=434234 RepID=A0ACC0ZXD2_9ROSI|nr:hypothetical protein Patl1_24092 [Pistacia atlantica]